MNREKALVKNTLILALGTYLPKLTTIITLPLLTGNLTKEGYGTYDLILTLVALLLPAMTLQIQSAAFRFLINHRHSKHEISTVVSNILAFTVCASIVGLLIVFFIIGHRFSLSLKLLMILYFFLDIIYICCGQITRGLGKNALYASTAVILSVVNLAGICIAVYGVANILNGIIVSMIVSCGIGITLLFCRVGIFSYFSFEEISIQKIKKLLSYSWPMVPNALSNWVLSLSDRLLIVGFLGIESNAIYAAANKIPNLAKTLQGTFASAWQENASLSVDDKDASGYYSKIFDKTNGIVIGLVAMLIATAPLFFFLLIRGDYEKAYPQMAILYVGVYFSCMSTFLGGIYVAYMRTKSVGLTTLAAAVCNIGINLIAMPHIGLFAASISTMVSYALLFLFRIINMRKFNKIVINYKKLLLYLIVIIIMCYFVYQRKWLFNILNAVLGIIFMWVVNKELFCNGVLSVIRKIRKKRIKNHVED
ncbi:MAG: oligosaccharide flippase family protein [Oscillospiraceae bacterium]